MRACAHTRRRAHARAHARMLARTRSRPHARTRVVEVYGRALEITTIAIQLIVTIAIILIVTLAILSTVIIAILLIGSHPNDFHGAPGGRDVWSGQAQLDKVSSARRYSLVEKVSGWGRESGGEWKREDGNEDKGLAVSKLADLASTPADPQNGASPAVSRPFWLPGRICCIP